MRRNSLIHAALVALLALPAVVRAQSLADVARAEEARRKTVKTPATVYTNEDLKGAVENTAQAPTTPAVAQPGAAKPGDAVTKPQNPADQPAAEGGPKKDEKYWRDRVASAQQALARNKVLLDALQTRVNALTTDFANTDDPAQRAIVEDNRKTALAEMERVKADIAKQNTEISNIQEEARKANVPPGWLR